MKKFVCVKFTKGNTTDVVYRGWMVDSASCKWPNSGNIQQMAQDCVSPEVNWKAYACSILCESKSYDRCIKKGYSVSDIESSEEEISLGPINDCILPPLVRSNAVSQRHCFMVPHQSVPRKKQKVQKSSTLTTSLTANVTHELMRISSQINQLTQVTKKLEQKVDSLLIMKDGKQLYDFKPASNEMELNDILLNIEDYMDIARRTERKSLRSTIRSFMKLFLKRELAITYSWSGLGNKRLATKKPFKKHQLYTILTRMLQFTSFKDVTIDNIENEIKVTLAGVGDWEGGREERRSVNRLSEKRSNYDSDTSTDTLPYDDIE